MSLKSENVRVATTGAVYIAPTTAERPTSATSQLSADHNDLGYVSDGGVTETRERSTNQIRAWQNGALVREPVTESSIRFSFVLIETKKETIELYYGVKVGADGSVKIDPSKTGGRQSMVLDIIDDDDLIRVDVPQGEVTEVGDQVYVNGEAIGYEVTITGYAITDGDESYSAVKWYSSLDTTTQEG